MCTASLCTASHYGLYSAGVGPYRAPDEQSWRSAGFTQYLQNKDDEFCSSWELELSVSLVQGLPIARTLLCDCNGTAPLRVRQEMERRQSKSRSKPSAVTANNPVWRAMLCVPPFAPVVAAFPGADCVTSTSASAAPEAETNYCASGRRRRATRRRNRC